MAEYRRARSWEVGRSRSIDVASGINYVAPCVGTDADPFLDADLPTQYIHFPEGRLSMAKIEELYEILPNVVGAGGRIAV